MVYFKTGGGAFIEVFDGHGDAQTPLPETASYRHFCLWVDDLEATLEGLSGSGLEIDFEAVRTGRSGCRQYFVSDPDGNRIELMQLLPGSMQARALTDR